MSDRSKTGIEPGVPETSIPPYSLLARGYENGKVRFRGTSTAVRQRSLKEVSLPLTESNTHRQNLPEHVATGDTIDTFKSILRERTNLAIWKRRVRPSLTQGLIAAPWPESFLHTARMNLHARKVVSGSESPLSSQFADLPLSFSQQIERMVNPKGASIDRTKAALDWLRQDIDFLCSVFSELIGHRPFHLSLMTIQETMCPAFHADSYELRMITTYFGPTTLWTPDENVNHEGMASLDSRERLYDPELYYSMPEQSVAIMKGDGFHNRGHGGIVHRSPEVEKGERRLVLRMEL